MLTSLPSLQQLADRYLVWQMILPVIGVWCYLLDGMFIGATRGAEMRNSMAVAAAGFALTLLTVPALGNHGLWPGAGGISRPARRFSGGYLAAALAAWNLVFIVHLVHLMVKDSE
ncbi:DNA-damage-inducible SOS response protein [Klebsiella grimontii]|uniref:DNA-damage-inducible SOS response protein n=1 Tax=Klebsiella grimontii TaxID=2058152 RepID=A0A7H4PC14_9ENTR|nr:DNA-damage-inducible SOS response protein [Klebsiella grimontii]